MLLLAYACWAPHTSRPVLELYLLHDCQASLRLFLTGIVSVVMFAMVFLVPVYLQDVQGRTATAAGLTLLPQGLVTGVGTWIGLTLPQRWGLRHTVLAGLALLTVGTVGLLAVTHATPPVVVAAILCGRGFAIGLVVQPLITTLIGGLPEDQVPDATTLFNVVERVSGTLGIALIVTLFQVRERVRVLAALGRVGSPPGSREAVRARRPLSTPVPHQLTHAATLGFHDVIWWVASASAMSVVLALGVKDAAAGSDT